VGARQLVSRAEILVVAHDHSVEMASRGAIFHNDAYFTAQSHLRLGASVFGENVAMNTSLDDAHRRLMASPGHRANILDARFRQVGFSVVSDGRDELFVTEDFAQPVGASAAPAPAGHDLARDAGTPAELLSATIAAYAGHPPTVLAAVSGPVEVPELVRPARSARRFPWAPALVAVVLLAMALVGVLSLGSRALLPPRL